MDQKRRGPSPFPVRPPSLCIVTVAAGPGLASTSNPTSNSRSDEDVSHPRIASPHSLIYTLGPPMAERRRRGSLAGIECCFCCRTPPIERISDAI